jgi:NAD(P)-dependent dehydrogenase (short-subunit alcohol dehydrogenase family)
VHTENGDIPPEVGTKLMNVQSGSGPGIVVLTGASSGIGRATAPKLADLGKSVVLVARRKEALEELAKELRRRAPNTNPAVYVADLTLQSEVRRLAKELESAYPKIDVLINCAGVYFHRREVTTEGVEKTWALNVLAPLLLTELLRPSLRAAAPSRVVMVSSMAHGGQHLEFDNLQGEKKYRGFRNYGRSKLALIYLTHQLAERYKADRIDVNSLHPGFIRSEFGRTNGGLLGAGMRFVELIAARSVEYGSRTPVYLATAPEVKGVTGQYFAKCKSVRSSPQSYDSEAEKRLWSDCAKRLGLGNGA